MQFLLRLSSWIDAFSTAIGRLLGWAAVLLVLIGVLNVFARYIGSAIGVQLSSNAWLEAQTYLYNIMFLLGAAYLLRKDGHIRVDIIFSTLGPRARAWIDVFGIVLLLVPFCVLTLYFSWGYVERSWMVWEQSPNPGGLPRYPIKTVILVGFSMLLLQALSELIKRIAFLRGLREQPTDAERGEAV